VRLATWNVNSLNARLPRVEEWLVYAQPDVLCLQETKLADAAFPALAFAGLGYEAAYHGDGRWNGVAILSRVGLDAVSAGFGADTEGVAAESRLLAATCAGIRVHSVYVPNGRSLDSDQYTAKLDWLASLKDMLEASIGRAQPVAVLGDFNIAPEDRDVYDPAKFVGATHASEPERAALAALQSQGLVDAFRIVYQQDRLFTWWDYRAGDFHNHRGMRIDLILVSSDLAGGVRWALVDRNARKGKGPSDHAPLIVDIDREDQ
jgi:exodeoxyribonuclease-3